jgi:YhcH/YjgK/YiaL family protein
MIFDQLTNHHLYPLGHAWQEAFEFLAALTPVIADGKHRLRGDDLFAIVMDYQTQPAETAELEAHRRYLDIQMLLAGREGVVCHYIADLQVLQPYDPAADAELYRIPAVVPARFILTPGTFLAFFPHDAHMPCLMLESGPEPVRKVVVKVAVELLARPGSSAAAPKTPRD